MDKLTLQKLRDLPIEGVAERLGLQVTRHKCLCPFHDDHHASLSFFLRRNTYRCFACGASGGTIDLVMQYLRKDFLDACRWLADSFQIPALELQSTHQKSSPAGGHLLGASSFQIGTSDSQLGASSSQLGASDSQLRTPDSQPSTLNSQLPFDPQRYGRYFEHPFLNEAARQFLFEERRLDERVVRWCRLTSWRDGRGVSWLQIPYFDREGRLTGVQYRNLVKGALPRFRFPSGSVCGIYNLPVLRMLRPHEALYLTEGPSDCWAMLSAGHKAIAIPSATLLSQQDVALLSSLASQLSTEFHMYPDRDVPGERLFLQLQHILPQLQHHHLPPTCKDFSDYYLLQRSHEARSG